jgi:hypothetical protein
MMNNRNYAFLMILLMCCSCGEKLYSYRKTVKVQDRETISRQQKDTDTGNEEEDIQHHHVSASAGAPLNIAPNTLYLTTKPVPVAKKKRTPSSSAMVR